jgi:polysaccharide export outer membrane protein
MRKAITLACLAAGLLLLAACATVPKVPSNDVDPLPAARLPLIVYPGDTLEVKFLYWPELDEEQVVTPDGQITLRHVNEVPVAWKSPDEIRDDLLKRYTGILKNPEITVLLRTEDRYVYVGGEVKLPGGLTQVHVPMRGRMTALQAVMAAGGLDKRSAKLQNVLIVRQFPDKECARTLDLRKAFREGDREPFYLEPFDIVFVPRTNIDRADQWVDQYMSQLVPDWLNMNMGFSRSRSRIDDSNRGSVAATVGGATVSVPR